MKKSPLNGSFVIRILYAIVKINNCSDRVIIPLTGLLLFELNLYEEDYMPYEEEGLNPLQSGQNCNKFKRRWQ